MSTLYIISFHIYNQLYEVPLSLFYMERESHTQNNEMAGPKSPDSRDSSEVLTQVWSDFTAQSLHETMLPFEQI